MIRADTTTILKLLGESIREKRKLRRIAGEIFARDSGISRSTLILIERGSPGVSIAAYIQALIALGLERRLIELAVGDPNHSALRKFKYPKFN